MWTQNCNSDFNRNKNIQDAFSGKLNLGRYNIFKNEKGLGRVGVHQVPCLKIQYSRCSYYADMPLKKRLWQLSNEIDFHICISILRNLLFWEINWFATWTRRKVRKEWMSVKILFYHEKNSTFRQIWIFQVANCVSTGNL